MKATAEKSTATKASTTHNVAKPFFAKSGGGDFFAPVKRGSPSIIQTKLTVNKPGDKYEQEADSMAEKVMRMPAEKKKETGKMTGPLKENYLQRKESEETSASGNQDVDDTLQTAIRSKTSGGEPLNGSSRKFMEPRFGNDFSNVRIHNNAESFQLNRQLNAKAFTYQNHIFFGAGQYQPETPGGKQLLAHELTHVVQQGASKEVNTDIQKKPEASDDKEQVTTKPEKTGTATIQSGILDTIVEGAGAVRDAATGIITNVSNALGTGYVAASSWIRGLASRVGYGIVTAWSWIRTLAASARLGVQAAWNWILNVSSSLGHSLVAAWQWAIGMASSIGLGIVAAWNWVREMASRTGQSIAAAWVWIQVAAIRIGTSILLAWNWLRSIAGILGQSVTSALRWIIAVGQRLSLMLVIAWQWAMAIAAAIGLHIRAAWTWINLVATRIAMQIISTFNWLMSVAARIGMAILVAWQWVQMISVFIGLTIRRAWQFIGRVAARIGMVITRAWSWVFSMASRIGMMISAAWAWVINMARRIGRFIVSAWNYLVRIAVAMGKHILSAWNWLVNLARRVGVAIAEAWDWYLHAPDISIETDFEAPDGSGKSRRKAGVGERVTFTGSKTGEWKASGGSPLTLALGTTFVWTAPSRAASVTISLKSGKYTRRVIMSVLEPNAITAKKVREIRYPRGRMGVGMKLKFHYHPKTVSFGNTDAKEVSGPATNVRGYFKDHGGDYRHDSGDTFFAINHDNVDTATDEASIRNYPSPWKRGGFDWIIPNHFKLRTEAGDGKKFTNVTQAFTMEGTDGTTRVSKGGEEAVRTP